MPYINIALSVLFIASFLVFFVPVEKLVKKTLDLRTSALAISTVLVLIVVGILIFEAGIGGVLYLTFSTFFVWEVTFGFLADRKYIFTLALIFLVFCPFLLIAKLDNIAELSAVLCYLCLVLGVFKDIFYEKIVSE